MPSCKLYTHRPRCEFAGGGKRGVLAEGFPAFVTLVGLFTSVNCLVLSKGGGVTKSLSTFITYIGFLPCEYSGAS